MSNEEQVQPVQFEAALHELAEIAANLETGSLPLEETFSQFERGISLLKHCYVQLEKVEQKVELLLDFDKQRQPVTAPFDASPTQINKNMAAEEQSAANQESDGNSNEESSQSAKEDDALLF